MLFFRYAWFLKYGIAVSNCFTGQKMYVKRLFCVPNGLGHAVCTGRTLLVYQQGQDIMLGSWEEKIIVTKQDI